MNLSNFGGFRVNPSPTNVTLVTILFQPFPAEVSEWLGAVVVVVGSLVACIAVVNGGYEQDS